MGDIFGCFLGLARIGLSQPLGSVPLSVEFGGEWEALGFSLSVSDVEG